MNYVYDIFLNFNKKLYDFFDWNLNDNIMHIKKIPFFKISTTDLNMLINNVVKLDGSFIDKIENKTEIFNKNKLVNIKYSCLISDNNKVIGIELDKRGYVINYSDLLIDEEEEILDYMYKIRLTKINFELINNNKKDKCFFTRKENMARQYIKKQINLIVKNKEYDKLRYLYYEIFNKQEIDKDKIVKKIHEYLNNNLDIKLNNFINVLKIKL